MAASTLQPERAEGHWLMLTYEDEPDMRFDARVLDRVLAIDEELLLCVDDTNVRLSMLGGPRIAAEIAEQLGPYTRAATITRPEVYRDAKQRLELASRNRRENGALVLFIRNHDVFVNKDRITIGDSFFLCTVAELRRDARDETLPRAAQAMMKLVFLLLAAKDREEDVAALARRVAEYEAQNPDEPDRGSGSPQ